MLSTRLSCVPVWRRRYGWALIAGLCGYVGRCLEPIVREKSRNADDTFREFKEITQYL